MVPEADSIYVMDRGYLDFAHLYRIHQNQAIFVTRAKSNFHYQWLYSQTVDKSIGLRCDQIIREAGYYQVQGYPETLRRIRYYDAKTDKRFIFLTNQFILPGITIAEL